MHETDQGNARTHVRPHRDLCTYVCAQTCHCAHSSTCTHKGTHTYAQMHINAHTCVHRCTCTHSHMCMHRDTHIRMHQCMYTLMHVCTGMRTLTHVHTSGSGGKAYFCPGCGWGQLDPQWYTPSSQPLPYVCFWGGRGQLRPGWVEASHASAQLAGPVPAALQKQPLGLDPLGQVAPAPPWRGLGLPVARTWHQAVGLCAPLCLHVQPEEDLPPWPCVLGMGWGDVSGMLPERAWLPGCTCTCTGERGFVCACVLV